MRDMINAGVQSTGMHMGYLHPTRVLQLRSNSAHGDVFAPDFRGKEGMTFTNRYISSRHKGSSGICRAWELQMDPLNVLIPWACAGVTRVEKAVSYRDPHCFGG